MRRYGLLTPIVQLVKHQRPSSWEGDASPSDLARIAQRADQLGYEFITCPEHVAIPDPELEYRGARFYDPLSTLGYLAALTESIRLVPQVIVLAYYHPLEIVKRYGTLDLLSGGRLTLGVGVGSLRQEFDMLGREFSGRGRRADDALSALRAAWASTRPTYHGTHYHFEGVTVEPCGLQETLPIWVGGKSLASLRRALELGDGWIPFMVSPGEARDMLQHSKVADLAEQRRQEIDVVLRSPAPMDPVGSPDATREEIDQIFSCGGDVVSAQFVHNSLEHYLEQMEAFAGVISTD